MIEHRLQKAHFGVAQAAFFIGTAMALMQALSRAALPLPGRTPKMYYPRRCRRTRPSTSAPRFWWWGRGAGKKLAEAPKVEFAQSLAPVTGRTIWDRVGLWTVVAVVLIAIAYFWPIAHLLSMERFGSPGFSPF